MAKTIDFLKQHLLDPQTWGKTIGHTLRVAIVVGLIALGWGYYKGYRNRPVHVDMRDAHIVLSDANKQQHTLDVKNGVMKFDGKIVSNREIPTLRAFGLEMHPKLAAGITSAGSEAVGVALEVAHAYNLNLDLLAMVPFIGAGISYDLHLNGPIKIDNTSIGIGVGRDLKAGENAAIVYISLDF
jgi:hypothetical protein